MDPIFTVFAVDSQTTKLIKFFTHEFVNCACTMAGGMAIVVGTWHASSGKLPEFDELAACQLVVQNRS